MEKIDIYFKNPATSGIFHDTRSDVKNLAKVCNVLIEKCNELVSEVNQLKKQIKKE